MRKIALILSVAVLAVAGTSCKKIKGSDNITSEVRAVDNFTKLDVQEAFEVDVTYSSTEELVVVEAPDNLHEYIEVNVVSGKLKVHFKHNVNISTHHKVKIHITTVELNGFNASGASIILLNNALNASDFDLELSGASNFEGEVNVTSTDIKMSGASNGDISGSSASAFVELSGASDLDDFDFVIDVLDVELSGASTASLGVTSELSAELSGASTLNYEGDPIITHINTSGASNINKN